MVFFFLTFYIIQALFSIFFASCFPFSPLLHLCIYSNPLYLYSVFLHLLFCFLCYFFSPFRFYLSLFLCISLYLCLKLTITALVSCFRFWSAFFPLTSSLLRRVSPSSVRYPFVPLFPSPCSALLLNLLYFLLLFLFTVRLPLSTTPFPLTLPLSFSTLLLLFQTSFSLPLLSPFTLLSP